MNAPVHDADLGRLRASLEAEFADLYRDNYAFVWRCARRMGVDEAELDDVIQDVFVIAYRHRARLEPGVAPSTWLFGILRNVLRNRSRGLARHRRRIQAFASHVDARERWRRHHETELGERLLTQARLAGFLAELGEEQRAVFVLAELEGHTGKEIAEALAINPNTAHSRLRLARRAFCAHFGIAPSRGALTSATRELREHAEQPSAHARAHGWGLIAAALARPAWWSGAGVSLLALLPAKATLAVTLGLALLTLGLGPRMSELVDAQTPAHASVHPLDEPARPRFAQAAEPAAVPVVAEPVIVSAQKPPASPQPGPSRADEQLRRARAALIEGQPDQALAALDAIARDDPSLLDPRAATRVAALCQLGEIDEARAEVERLRETRPSSTILTRIDGACW